MGQAVTIRVNGAPRELSAGASVVDLLRALDLGENEHGLAVELNREVIPRRLHGETRLRDGDEVEIVTFVGGG